MLKRPLCYLCMAYVVSVLFFLLFLRPSFDVKVKEGQWENIFGVVYEKEVTSDSIILYLKNVQILQQSNSQKEKYHILCYCDATEKIPQIGTGIVVKGRVRLLKEARNPGEFDAKDYYEMENVAFCLEQTAIIQYGETYDYYKESLFLLRQKLLTIFDLYMTESDAAVMKAMLLGDKKSMEKEQKTLFRQSGISHILAISGLHISILGMGLYKILKKCKIMPLPATLIAVLLMKAYGDLVGMSGSAMRAIIMFGFQLGALLLKRTYDRKTALAVAAACILLEQPLYLFQAGFLLSFGAVLGITCVAPIFRTESTMQKIYLNLSIMLVQFPIMLYFFYEFSLYSILVNIMILPLTAFLLLLGVCCVLLGSAPVIGGAIGVISGAGCHILIAFFEKVCEYSLKLPNAQCITGRPQMWKILCYYAVLLWLCLYESNCLHGKKRIKFSNRLKGITMLVAVHLLVSNPTDAMHITFLDVGQGDCIWIENENGHHYLIDCGSTSKSKVGTYTLIPYLKYQGVSQIEMLFVTHLDSDHISGVLELLDNGEGIKVKQLLLSEKTPQNETYRNLIEKCKEKKVTVSFLTAGDTCTDGKMKLEILYPSETDVIENTNASSLIIKMEYENFHALFTGDAEASGEAQAAEVLKGWDCHLFKVTHHGSSYSNTVCLLETIRPQISVISCGEKNTYGHPHPETIERLENVNSHIYMTKEKGAIEISIRPGKIGIETHLQ